MTLLHPSIFVLKLLLKYTEEYLLMIKLVFIFNMPYLLFADLNVEHAQLLVYLFHSLTLMQKKSVLLMTSNAIIKVNKYLVISNRFCNFKISFNFVEFCV